MKISFVRGAYLNNFEGQNFDLHVTGYSSLFPLDSNVPFPIVKLPSIADLQKIPLFDKPIKYIANRTLGDSQILFGLEKNIIYSDIVHVADLHYYYSYQAAQLKKKRLIKKLVSTWWETIPFNNESTDAKKRIKKYCMSQVDRFFCYTEKAKKCLIEEGVDAQRISVLPLGVNTSLFKPCLSTKQSKFNILFVGRLVEEKGILDLYTSFKQLIEDGNNAFLRIIGTGPLKGILQNHIQKDGFQDKITIEKKSYKEMPEVYQQASVLCVPSKKTKTWEEQYGMVFVEALASGLPIVSYDTGVIKSIVGNGGIIVAENDISGITNSLERIMKAELRGKIGTIGRERAELFFNSQKTKQTISKLYKGLFLE